MRQSDITTIHNTRRRAGRGMVISIAAIAAGIMLLKGTLYEPEHVAIGMDQYWAVIKWTIIVFGVLFAGGWLAAFINGIIFLRAGRDRNEPPAVTYENTNDASNVLDFPAMHTPADARIEVHDGNTIRLGKHQPDYGTWANLADALYAHRWEWSRERALRESGCFKNLTAIYPELTADMLNIGIIEGRRNHYRASLKGQQWFIKQSPALFLEHVIR